MKPLCGIVMTPTRFALVLFCAIAGTVAAIPAADEDATLLAAFRGGKTKEERLALLKGKDGQEIERFLLKLFNEQDAPLARGEFAEVDRLQLWAEEVTTLIADPDRRELCDAICQVGRGRLEFAMEHFDEAAAIYKKLLVTASKPQFKAMKAPMLSNLAAVQSRQGDYIGGLKTIEEARALLADLEGFQRDIVEAKLLGNLGQLHMEIGDYDEAEKVLKESVRLAEKNKNTAAALTSRVNLAAVNTHRCRYAEAIKAYEELLDDCRKSGNKLMEVSILNDLGMVLAEYGRVGEAIRRLEEARKLAVALKHRRTEALALFNLAVIHSRLDTTDAARYLREALALFQAVGDKVGVARCMRLAGILDLLANKKGDADKDFAEALAAAKASGSKADIAQVGWMIGMQLFEAREWKKAGETFAEALKAYQTLSDRRRILLVRQMRLLCLAATDDDRYFTEFVAFKKDALAFKDPQAEVTVHYLTALGAVVQKQWGLAITEANSGIRTCEKRRELIEDPQLQISASGKSDLPQLYSILAAAQAGRGDQPAAFLAMERAKGWVLNHLLNRSRVSIRKGMTQDEQKEEEKLRGAVMAAAGKSGAEMRFANATPGKADALKMELEEAEARYEEFQRKISLTHPELPTRRGELPPVDLVALQKNVFSRAPDLAILSYLEQADGLMIAVVTAGDKADGPARVVVHKVAVERKELAEAAERFWKLCQNAKAGRPVSDDLYKWLIEPAAKDIAGKKHLLIVPCHPLLAVPFQALAPNLEEPYLIEQFAISYAPSVAALLEMRRRGDSVRGPGRADRLQLLAIGGVKFTPDLEELPASGPEAEEVAKVFGSQSRILLAEDATRAEVVKAIPTARFIHFATHGLVNPPRPLFSALAVSPVGKEDDGRLYAHDVLNLDLSAEMVVLSACDTGRGRDYRGEGTVGLAWAFFVAGTPTAVVSQWKVSDKTTAELMRVFYDRLRSGKDVSKAESLRQAALALLKENKTRHPKYWAAFTMIGDWRK